MDTFDFNAPIDTTIIFDDNSDDDTKPNVDELQLPNDETNNILSKDKTDTQTQETSLLQDMDKSLSHKLKIKKVISETIKAKFYDNSVTTETAKNHSTVQKYLSMPSLEDNDCIHDTSIIQIDSNNKTDKKRKQGTEKNNNHKNTKKRNISSSDKTKLKRRLSENINLNEDTNKVNHVLHRTKNNKQSRDCIKSQTTSNNTVPKSTYQECIPTKSIQVPLSQSEKSNATNSSECIQIYSNDVHNQHQPHKNISPESKDNDVNQTITNYLREILNTVSEHMICIINSYQSYHRLNKSGTDRSLIEIARNNFICTKNHFFELSYSSIVNIILPKLSNNGFVKQFIQYTIRLARSKSYPYSYIHMEPLFYEMIDWAKRKQKEIETKNITKVSNPLLSHELNKPIQYCNKLPPPYPNQCQHLPTLAINKQRVNTPNLPEITICMEPTHFIHQNELRQTRCPIVMPQQNICGYNNTEISNNEVVRSKHTIKASTNTNEQQTCINSMGPRQNQPTQAWQSQNSPPRHITTAFQNQTWQNPITQSQQKHTTPPWAQNVENQPTQAYQKQITQPLPSVSIDVEEKQANLCYTSEINTLMGQPNRYNQLDQCSSNPLDASQNCPYSRQESPAQVEPNRSISRDSGFISPLDFNTSNVQLQMQEEPRLQPTPLITHVTSLNPNVSYIMDGMCSVCGKITRKKCLGCYKCYYCSHDCQFLDWKNHMAICK